MQNSSSFAKELAKGCKTVEDIQEKLKSLFKNTLQEIFEAEMEHILVMRIIILLVTIAAIVEMATWPGGN